MIVGIILIAFCLVAVGFALGVKYGSKEDK